MQASIIVLCPTRGVILTEVQEAVDKELIRNKQIPLFIRTHDLALPLSRNFLVESALKVEGWTHALLLDDDVVLPKGAIKEMLALKADIAIMDYPMHYLMDNKGVGTLVKDKDGTIAWGGLGSTLVKREVFEKMAQPWFVLTKYRINRIKDGTIGFYASQSDGEMLFSGGEDVHFFLNARKLGFSIKATKHTAIHAHVEQYVTTTQNLRYQTSHRIAQRNKIERELL